MKGSCLKVPGLWCEQTLPAACCQKAPFLETVCVCMCVGEGGVLQLRSLFPP